MSIYLVITRKSSRIHGCGAGNTNPKETADNKDTKETMPKTEPKIQNNLFSIGELVTVDLFGAGIVTDVPHTERITKFTPGNKTITNYKIRLVGGSIIEVKPEFITKYSKPIPAITKNPTANISAKG